MNKSVERALRAHQKEALGLVKAASDKKSRIAALEAERDELQHVFDTRWDADMRAIKRWQAAHPEKGAVWPDHVDMVAWLLARAEASESALREALDTKRLDWLTDHSEIEISCSWEEEDGPWQVHAVLGGRNDREWHKRGQGATPRDAIDAARAFIEKHAPAAISEDK